MKYEPQPDQKESVYSGFRVDGTILYVDPYIKDILGGQCHLL